MKIEWMRQGNNYDADPTEIGGAIHMGELTERVKRDVAEQVGTRITGDYEVGVTVLVTLSGGPFNEWDFGQGRVVQ